MSKPIQINIAEPCHENWDMMTQAEKGRFCASCQKKVIDFTNMSDSQLATFFKKPKEESVCGRFYQDQLDRNIEIPKKRIPWVKYFFQFALPAFLISMKGTAQGKVKIRTATNTVTSPTCSMTMGIVAPPKRTVLLGKPTYPVLQPAKPVTVQELGTPNLYVTPAPHRVFMKGVVLDENSNPVPFATVMIKGTKIGVAADSVGVFKLENLEVQGEIILQVSSVGYEAKEVLVNNEELPNDLQVQLDRLLSGDVVIVSSYGNKLMGRVGLVSIITSEKRNIMPDEKSSPTMIKVYPNPVVAGTNMNIGCQRLKEGYYVIQLCNQSGQQVLNKQTWIDGGIQVLNIDIPRMVTGVYFLKLTNKETNKRFTQKIIVQ